MARDQSRDDVGLQSLRDIERRHIRRVLDAVGWNKKRAARILEINRGTLYRKIGEYDLADRRASPPVGVDPVRTLATDTDHDQRDTGATQHEPEAVSEPRLPGVIAEHQDGRPDGEGDADDDGGGSGPSQTE